MKPLYAHFAHHFIPEALGIFAREAQELVAAGETQAAQETPDVGLFDELGLRLPDRGARLRL
jgi:hypothetical protein